MPKPSLVHSAALPPSDPARAALAEAIRARDAVQDDVRALQDAQAASSEAIRAARSAHAAAERAVTEAKEAAAGASLERAMGRQGDSPQPLSAARRRLTDAEDALDVARQAERQRADRLEERTRRLSYESDHVEQAARRVLAESDALQGLLLRAGDLQREMLDAALALSWVMAKGAIRDDPSRPPEVRDAIDSTNHRLRTPPERWNGLLHHRAAVAGSKPWEAAFAALCADAGAELPS